MTPQTLISLLLEDNYSFITGVPDSIFKHLIIAVNKDSRFQHVISNNEGEACALAAGYHLASGKIPIVYLQNSGLGNCINPLTSLLDAYIYSIPTLLLIGWRGIPGEKDEPQHLRMGEVTAGLLALLNIPYSIADPSEEKIKFCLNHAKQNLKQHSKPYAILFPKNVITVEEEQKKEKVIPSDALLREELLEIIVKNIKKDAILVTTTGKTSRELFEIRQRLGHDHSHDFLTVGSMGCAASIALGIATQTERQVVLIDGDGACLMRMEALASIGYMQPKNFLHVLVDNNAYESTGSQKTQSSSVDFAMIAKACNYKKAIAVDSLSAFQQQFHEFSIGPSMIVVKSFPYSRPELGRPKTTPVENKRALMNELGITQ